MQIYSVGIDLGKTTFHLVALGAAGKVLVRKKFTQKQLLAYTANMQTSLIGMEACSGAHFLGRALRQQGHDVRLIPAQFVKPFVKSNKNDFVDAEAIAEAVERKNMRFVPIKTDDQLDLQAILLLLSIVLMNTRNLLLVLVNVPFALLGGVAIVFLTGNMLSLGGLIGFVTLFGITLRNSIMMISHYEHLIEVEGMTWGLEASMRGAMERLTPILMTATVTGLGLLPLALGSGNSGREIEGPMAIVILGGLVTSTILNLLVLPTLALRYGKFEKTDRGRSIPL